MTDATIHGAVAGPRRTGPHELAPADAAWVLAPRRGRAAAQLRVVGRTVRAPSVAVPLAVFVLIALACFAGPAILGLPSPVVGNLDDAMLPIGSPGHLLGTNELGNDVLSRLLHGGRVSILVGIGATAVSLVVGSILGMTAGFVGGIWEKVVMRVFDTMLAFPGLILALILADYLGPSATNTLLAIGVFGVARFGRLSWAQTLGVRHRDFVVAAVADGAPARRIVLGHMLPNVMPTMLSFALFTIGTAMMIEAGLSYLGLGVPQPQPTWGNMISTGDAYLSAAPRLVILPSIFLIATVLSLNLVADAFRVRVEQER